MKTDLTIIRPDYTDINQTEVDRLFIANEALQAEVKLLRKEKDSLLEELSWLKKFSDRVWARSQRLL